MIEVSIQKINLFDQSMYCKARDRPISLQVCLKNTEYDTEWGHDVKIEFQGALKSATLAGTLL